jgi:hypothetical protein
MNAFSFDGSADHGFALLDHPAVKLCELFGAGVSCVFIAVVATDDAAFGSSGQGAAFTVAPGA